MAAVCGPVESERVLVVCNVKDVCRSLQGQELGLFRRVTHCRALLCYIL